MKRRSVKSIVRDLQRMSRREALAVVDGLILEELKRTPRALYTVGCLDLASRVAGVTVVVVFALWLAGIVGQ